MYAPAPTRGTTRLRLDSVKLATTLQRTQRQLGAVIQLAEHNADYLEPSERSWIEHIISDALAASEDLQESARFTPNQQDKMNMTASALRERLGANGSTARSPSPPGVDMEYGMEILLATSKGLNSANNLLSCCYDRWSWIQSQQYNRPMSQTASDDLQELLGRRKQRQRPSVSIVPQSSPEPTRPSQWNDTPSSPSSRIPTTTSNGSEHSLSLAVDDTIDKWRQNAEDALNETTARLAAGNTSPYRTSAPQQLQNAYSCPACTMEQGNPGYRIGTDATAMHTCGSKRSSSRLSSSIPSPGPSFQQNSQSPKAVTSSNRYTQPASPPMQQFEIYHTVQPTFRATLHNSFEKEAVDAASHRTNEPMFDPSANNPLTHSGSRHYSLPTRNSHTSPVRWQTLGTTVEHPPSLPRRPESSESTLNAYPMTIPANSMQVEPSTRERTTQSRSRRWLEQHSEWGASRY